MMGLVYVSLQCPLPHLMVQPDPQCVSEKNIMEYFGSYHHCLVPEGPQGWGDWAVPPSPPACSTTGLSFLVDNSPKLGQHCILPSPGISWARLEVLPSPGLVPGLEQPVHTFVSLGIR